MYPTLVSPAAAPTIATMLNEQAVAEAEHRRNVAQAREARHALSRKATHGADPSKPRHRVRPAVAAAGLALVVMLGLSTTGSLPIGQHDAQTPRATRYP